MCEDRSGWEGDVYMGNMAKFELVSKEQFIGDAENAFDINEKE